MGKSKEGGWIKIWVCKTCGYATEKWSPEICSECGEDGFPFKMGVGKWNGKDYEIKGKVNVSPDCGRIEFGRTMRVEFASERVDYDNATRLTIIVRQDNNPSLKWRDFQDFPDTDEWSVIVDCLLEFSQKIRNKSVFETVREQVEYQLEKAKGVKGE